MIPLICCCYVRSLVWCDLPKHYTVIHVPLHLRSVRSCYVTLPTLHRLPFPTFHTPTCTATTGIHVGTVTTHYTTVEPNFTPRYCRIRLTFVPDLTLRAFVVALLHVILCSIWSIYILPRFGAIRYVPIYTFVDFHVPLRSHRSRLPHILDLFYIAHVLVTLMEDSFDLPAFDSTGTYTSSFTLPLR